MNTLALLLVCAIVVIAAKSVKKDEPERESENLNQPSLGHSYTRDKRRVKAGLEGVSVHHRRNGRSTLNDDSEEIIIISEDSAVIQDPRMKKEPKNPLAHVKETKKVAEEIAVVRRKRDTSDLSPAQQAQLDEMMQNHYNIQAEADEFHRQRRNGTLTASKGKGKGKGAARKKRQINDEDQPSLFDELKTAMVEKKDEVGDKMGDMKMDDKMENLKDSMAVKEDQMDDIMTDVRAVMEEQKETLADKLEHVKDQVEVNKDELAEQIEVLKDDLDEETQQIIQHVKERKETILTEMQSKLEDQKDILDDHVGNMKEQVAEETDVLEDNVDKLEGAMKREQMTLAERVKVAAKNAAENGELRVNKVEQAADELKDEFKDKKEMSSKVGAIKEDLVNDMDKGMEVEDLNENDEDLLKPSVDSEELSMRQKLDEVSTAVQNFANASPERSERLARFKAEAVAHMKEAGVVDDDFDVDQAMDEAESNIMNGIQWGKKKLNELKKTEQMDLMQGFFKQAFGGQKPEAGPM